MYKQSVIWHFGFSVLQQNDLACILGGRGWICHEVDEGELPFCSRIIWMTSHDFYPFSFQHTAVMMSNLQSAFRAQRHADIEVRFDCSHVAMSANHEISSSYLNQIRCGAAVFAVHKVIVCAFSRHLDSLCADDASRASVRIEEDADVGPKMLSALLEFIYAGEVTVDESHVETLLKVCFSHNPSY